MKKITIIMLGLIVSMFFFVGFIVFFNDNDSNITETRRGIPDVNSPGIEWNGTELFDSTVYYPDNNTCYGSRYGMRIDISPCVAQSPTGRDIEQYVNFTWNGVSPRNTSWIFIYDGELEKGRMEANINKSYTYYENVHSLQWIANHIVDKVVTYTDLGSPTSACEIGSSLNNTRMFNVTRQNGTEQYNSIYCFTSVTPINATAFQISGWRDVYTPTEMMGYRYEWVDITDKISYLGSGLLNDSRSYYKVQDSVEFDVGETIQTKWIYTSANASALGKWHIFGYDGDTTLVESIIADQYIYIDPWWDNDWRKKRLINITSEAGDFIYLDLNYSIGMNANFSDLRFINEAEDTELDFTIESYVASTNVSVRIRTEGNTNIYVYYDNPSATLNSNASDVYYNPLLYYYLDEIAGTNVWDAISGLNSTANNQRIFTSEIGGIVQTGADFTQGVDHTVNSSTTTSPVTSGGTWSIQFWLNGTDTSSNQYIIDNRPTGSGGNIQIIFNGGNFIIFDNANAQDTLDSIGDILNGTWNHVVIVGDGTTARYYLNGQSIINVSIAASNFGGSSASFVMGGIRPNGGAATVDYNGKLEEVAIWNSALNISTIKKLYNQTMPGYTVGGVEDVAGISIASLLPVDEFVTPNGTMLFQVNITASSPAVIANTTLFVWNSSGTLIVENTTTFPEEPAAYINNWTIDFTAGNYTWTANAYSNTGDLANTTNRTFSVDTSAPVVVIDSPVDASDYVTITLPINVTLNSTASDPNLDDCWYYTSDNETNVSFTCNSSINVLFSSAGNKAIVVFANDTAGNEGSAITTFEIVYYTYSISYDNSVVEGQKKDINLTLDSNQLNTSILANLYWNDTTEVSVSKSIINSSRVVFSTPSTVPSGYGNSTGKNVSFYWRFYLSNGDINITTNTSQQTVFTLEIDNCSALSTLLLNYTMYDEDARTLINGTNKSGNIQLDVTVTSVSNSSQSVNVSKEYSNTNNALVCISSIDTGFRVDAQARYTATDYVTEYHNIQNATLSASNFPQNISLYVLDSLSSQEFLITVKDTAFVPIADALVEITREYLPLGQFLTVEIPKTDYDGRTIGHFVLNDEVYTIYVKKNGRLISVFENVRAFCSDVSTGDCRINLNAGSVGTQTKQFKTEQNVSFAQTYNDTTKVYKVTFTTTDSSVKTINISVKKFDTFLNDTICSETISSSSGSLTCTIPSGYYNKTILTAIYVDGEQVSSSIFDVSITKTQLNSIRWLFAFILVTTLPLLAITSAPMALIFFIVGVIAAGALALVDLGGYVGAFSALIWLVIAALILIWKATRPKEVLG